MTARIAPIVIRPIDAATARPLRQKVLRPHQAADALVYPRDDAPGAVHIGAFLEGRLVGIASLAPEPFALMPGEPASYRLRGMATEPDLRSHGIGGAVLEAGLSKARDLGARLVWCNARVPAEPFYLRHAFQREGDVFALPEIGPHVVMWRRLAA